MNRKKGYIVAAVIATGILVIVGACCIVIQKVSEEVSTAYVQVNQSLETSKKELLHVLSELNEQQHDSLQKLYPELYQAYSTYKDQDRRVDSLLEDLKQELMPKEGRISSGSTDSAIVASGRATQLKKALQNYKQETICLQETFGDSCNILGDMAKLDLGKDWKWEQENFLNLPSAAIYVNLSTISMNKARCNAMAYNLLLDRLHGRSKK